MKEQLELLIAYYQLKSDKCRDTANRYKERDDIYATFISSAETFELVIIDLKKLLTLI